MNNKYMDEKNNNKVNFWLFDVTSSRNVYWQENMSCHNTEVHIKWSKALNMFWTSL